MIQALYMYYRAQPSQHLVIEEAQSSFVESGKHLTKNLGVSESFPNRGISKLRPEGMTGD